MPAFVISEALVRPAPRLRWQPQAQTPDDTQADATGLFNAGSLLPHLGTADLGIESSVELIEPALPCDLTV